MDFKQKNNNLYLLVLTVVTLLYSCTKESRSITVEYETDLQEFINPERGFYRPFGTKLSDFKPLNAEVLLNLRKPNLAAGGFQVGSSLTYRAYQFDIFRDKELTEDVFVKIQNDMDIIRTVGNKMVLRFTYSDNCCTPPFNDAPKAIILNHLEQLKPILDKNKDVISLVQMGLIGPWGEQYYSDHFGDLEHGPVTDQHWLDRSEIINKLLEVVPTSRMIQVRAPYYKLRYLDGKDAHPTRAMAKALTEKEAFKGTPISRIAHHNDCIMANYDDYWTYNSFHTFPAVSDTLNLKPYIAAETKFLVFGGETCPGGDKGEDVYSPHNDCESEGGKAEHYLKRFHTSFLNTAWAGAVNGDWNNKCIDEIKRNLGYRFVLKRGVYPASIKNGENMTLELDFVNDGYASTYNYRYAELVLRNKTSKDVYKMKLDCDTRYWFPDELHKVKVDAKWPNTLAKGSYELFINFPDAEASLHERPEYAVRLASTLQSKTIWDQTTGWNLLNNEITVE